MKGMMKDETRARRASVFSFRFPDEQQQTTQNGGRGATNDLRVWSRAGERRGWKSARNARLFVFFGEERAARGVLCKNTVRALCLFLPAPQRARHVGGQEATMLSGGRGIKKLPGAGPGAVCASAGGWMDGWRRAGLSRPSGSLFFPFSRTMKKCLIHTHAPTLSLSLSLSHAPNTARHGPRGEEDGKRNTGQAG
jgi:hypothetical protein